MEIVRQLGYERLRDLREPGFGAPNDGKARQKLELAACGTKLHPGNNVPACSDSARFPDVSVAELIRADSCRERSSDIRLRRFFHLGANGCVSRSVLHAKCKNLPAAAAFLYCRFALTSLSTAYTRRALERQAVSNASVGTDHPPALSGSFPEDWSGHQPRRMPLKRCRI